MRQPLRQHHRPNPDVAGLPRARPAGHLHSYDITTAPILMWQVCREPGRRVTCAATTSAQAW
ncbi:MAG: hypothetical protein M3313_08350, partial [Actinomycetota bacterium]|nr:hypothetical protein [Actinomycetota bacterium]